MFLSSPTPNQGVANAQSGRPPFGRPPDVPGALTAGYVLTGFTRAREYQKPLSGERLGSLPEGASRVAFRLNYDNQGPRLRGRVKLRMSGAWPLGLRVDASEARAVSPTKVPPQAPLISEVPVPRSAAGPGPPVYAGWGGRHF